MREVYWCGACADWIDPFASAMITVPGIRLGPHAATFHPACYVRDVDPAASSAVPGCTGVLKPGRALVNPVAAGKLSAIRKERTEKRTLPQSAERVADVNSDEAIYEID